MNSTHVKIIDAWAAREKAQDLKPGTVKHTTAQLEFFLGAQTALEAAGQEGFHDMFLVCLSVGRSASDFRKKEAADVTQ